MQRQTTENIFQQTTWHAAHCTLLFAFELKNHLHLTYPTGWDDLRYFFLETDGRGSAIKLGTI
jgi:hypothetical protein